MGFPTAGWSNKGGTSARACACGTWRKHWVRFSGNSWPAQCSVQGCTDSPTLGGHVTNPQVTGEKIVPLCDSCNGVSQTFTLKEGITCVSANKAETCEKTG